MPTTSICTHINRVFYEICIFICCICCWLLSSALRDPMASCFFVYQLFSAGLQVSLASDLCCICSRCFLHYCKFRWHQIFRFVLHKSVVVFLVDFCISSSFVVIRSLFSSSIIASRHCVCSLFCFFLKDCRSVWHDVILVFCVATVLRRWLCF